MATPVEMLAQMSNLSFDIAADPPSLLTNGYPATNSRSSSPYIAPCFFFCPSIPSLSPLPPCLCELSDPPDLPFPSQAVTALEPTQSQSTSWSLSSENRPPLENKHTSLSSATPSTSFCPLPSLPASPHSTPPATRQSQLVTLPSTPAAAPARGHSSAAPTTDAAVIRVSSTLEAELPSVQLAASLVAKNTAGHSREYSVTLLQNSDGLSKGLSGPPKTSSECSQSGLPNSLCEKEPGSPPATASGILDPSAWAAAPLSSCLDLEAFDCLARRDTTRLPTCDLHSSPLLSPPPAEILSPFDETEALRPNLGLDSLVPIRLSSPDALHCHTRHRQRAKCNGARANLSSATFISTAQTPKHTLSGSHHLPPFPSFIPKSLGSLSCRHCSPCISHAPRAGTHSVEAGQAQTGVTIFNSRSLPVGVSAALVGEPDFLKNAEQRILSIPLEEQIQPARHMEATRTDSTAGSLKKRRFKLPVCCDHVTGTNGEMQEMYRDAVTWARCPSTEGSDSSASILLQTCCRQSGPQSSANQRGGSRKKRKCGTSAPSGRANAATSYQNSAQEVVQPLAQPAMLSGASVSAAQQPSAASCFSYTPSGLSTSASTAVSAFATSRASAVSMSPARDCYGLRASPSAFDGVSTMFSAPDRSCYAGTVGPAGKSSAAFHRAATTTAIDGARADSAAYCRSGAWAAGDTGPAASAAPATPPCDLLFGTSLPTERFASPSPSAPYVPQNTTKASALSARAAAISALAAEASAFLSRGAVVYALAVKLFGFTPTPGFLPDPNPFDNLDRYLANKENSTKLTVSLAEPRGTNDSALRNSRVPPSMTNAYSAADGTLSRPQPTVEEQGSSYSTASATVDFNPYFLPSSIGRWPVGSKAKCRRMDMLTPGSTEEGEMRTPGSTSYMVASQLSTTVGPLVDPAARPTGYSSSEAAVEPLAPVDMYNPNCDRLSQGNAAVVNESKPSFALPYSVSVTASGEEEHHTQSGSQCSMGGFVSEMSTPQKEVLTSGGPTGQGLARQGCQPLGVTHHIPCNALVNNSHSAVDRNHGSEGCSMQEGIASTAYEGFRTNEGRKTEAYGDCNPYFPQQEHSRLGSVDFTQVEPESEGVYHSFGGEASNCMCLNNPKNFSSGTEVLSTIPLAQNNNDVRQDENPQLERSADSMAGYLQIKKSPVPVVSSYSDAPSVPGGVGLNCCIPATTFPAEEVPPAQLVARGPLQPLQPTVGLRGCAFTPNEVA